MNHNFFERVLCFIMENVFLVLPTIPQFSATQFSFATRTNKKIKSDHSALEKLFGCNFLRQQIMELSEALKKNLHIRIGESSSCWRSLTSREFQGHSQVSTDVETLIRSRCMVVRERCC